MVGSNDFGGAPSARTRVRRGVPRVRYGRDDVLGILDAGMIAHVGVAMPEGPLVLPMAYGHDGERLYMHGAAANHLLGGVDGRLSCRIIGCPATVHLSAGYSKVVSPEGLAMHSEAMLSQM